MNSLEFEREKACYENNCKHAIGLNSQLFQVPTITMTLTGGLWFGAGAIKELAPGIRFGLLLFAGFCNIAMILVIVRIRDVFQEYLNKISGFEHNVYVLQTPVKKRIPWLRDYSMVRVFSLLMGIAAFFSFLGAFSFYWPYEFSRWIGLSFFFIFVYFVYRVFLKKIA